MVVRDLDLVSVAVLPDEAHAPLLIDSDAVLTHPIAAELLQAVSGWVSQVADCSCVVDHPQLPQSDALDVTRQPSRALPSEHPLSLTIGERPDHYSPI